jgi:hypothetical protein
MILSDPIWPVEWYCGVFLARYEHAAKYWADKSNGRLDLGLSK